MKIKDLIVWLPGAIIGTLSKTIQTQIPEATKQYIENNHLYHCTKDKETVNKILESRIYKTRTRYTRKGYVI